MHQDAEMLSLEPLPLLLFNNVAVELHSLYTIYVRLKKKGIIKINHSVFIVQKELYNEQPQFII